MSHGSKKTKSKEPKENPSKAGWAGLLITAGVIGVAVYLGARAGASGGEATQSGITYSPTYGIQAMRASAAPMPQTRALRVPGNVFGQVYGPQAMQSRMRGEVFSPTFGKEVLDAKYVDPRYTPYGVGVYQGPPVPAGYSAAYVYQGPPVPSGYEGLWPAGHPGATGPVAVRRVSQSWDAVKNRGSYEHEDDYRSF